MAKHSEFKVNQPVTFRPLHHSHNMIITKVNIQPDGVEVVYELMFDPNNPFEAPTITTGSTIVESILFEDYDLVGNQKEEHF